MACVRVDTVNLFAPFWLCCRRSLFLCFSHFPNTNYLLFVSFKKAALDVIKAALFPTHTKFSILPPSRSCFFVALSFLPLCSRPSFTNSFRLLLFCRSCSCRVLWWAFCQKKEFLFCVGCCAETERRSWRMNADEWEKEFAAFFADFFVGAFFVYRHVRCTGLTGTKRCASLKLLSSSWGTLNRAVNPNSMNNRTSNKHGCIVRQFQSSVNENGFFFAVLTYFSMRSSRQQNVWKKCCQAIYMTPEVGAGSPQYKQIIKQFSKI